jgi:NAD-dependent dihydropyrimidine dehydrogenase PreA subunit
MHETMPAEEDGEDGEESGESITAWKYVPVISDYCTGCGKCVNRCPHACLEPAWEFATLVRPDVCVSGGDCIEVCEDDAIHMKWVQMTGNPEVGEWSEDEPTPEAKKSLWQRMIGKG